MRKGSHRYFGQLRTAKARAVLVPYGVYLNSNLPELRKGDVVTFVNDKLERVEISHIMPLRIGSREFMAWLDVIYGGEKTWRRLERDWEAHAAVMGYGVEGFSRKECYLMICKPILEKDDTPEADNLRIGTK